MVSRGGWNARSILVIDALAGELALASEPLLRSTSDKLKDWSSLRGEVGMNACFVTGMIIAGRLDGKAALVDICLARFAELAVSSSGETAARLREEVIVID